MAKIETAYSIADKRYRTYRKLLFTDAWAAGRTRTWELSVLPAGEYLECIYFWVAGTYQQDGNGSDGIETMQLVNCLDSIEINNGSNTHLRQSLGMIAQDFKMNWGHNSFLPDDIAASSTGSEVETDFGIMIPFVYTNPAFYRPDDFAYPSSLLQDGNLTIHWNADASLIADAVSTITEATLQIYAVTSRINRATIPPEVECGFISSANDDFRLPRGNYQYVWMTGLSKDDAIAYPTVYAEADGLDVIAANTRVDALKGMHGLDHQWCDDDMQCGLAGDVLDKNIPPQSITAAIDWYLQPLYFGNQKEKLAKILRVESSFNFQLAGTTHAKVVCYRRYMNHTESGLDARAKIMGFGPGSSAVPRTNRRTMNRGDLSLANLLPVRLVQSPPV